MSESAPSAPVEALPPDLLAGPVSDDVLQQLLLQSTPGALSSSDPEVPTAVEAAWMVLVEDLQAGGWSSPHRQAVVLTASGRDSRDGQLPIVVDVHLMWSAVASSGDLDDRQLAVVRLQRGGGRWAGQILDSAGTTP